MDKSVAIEKRIIALAESLAELGATSITISVTGPKENFSPSRKILYKDLEDGNELAFQIMDIEGPIDIIASCNHVGKQSKLV